jgi:hypothetical protein
MLATYKITIKNNQEYVSEDDMFRILYVEYLDAVRRRLEKSDTIYERRDHYNSPRFRSSASRKLEYHINNSGEEYYKVLLAILMSRKLYAFLDWKPYVKTVNMAKIARKLRTIMRLMFSHYGYRRDKNKFDHNDHHINILWHLYERGMFFDRITDVPKSLRKLTRAYLYMDYYLDKLFEYDYVQDNMTLFSNNPKETYYNPYYRNRYGYQTPAFQHQNFEFDNHEFNSRFITMPTMATTGSGADYMVYDYDDASQVTVAITAANSGGTNYISTSNYTDSSLTSGDSTANTWRVNI